MEQSPGGRSLALRRLIVLAAVIGFVALSYFWIDRPVLFMMAGLDSDVRGFWKAFTKIGSSDPWAIAAVAIGLAGLMLRRQETRRALSGKLIYVSAAVLLGYAAVNALKFLFGRYRPEMLLDHGLYGLTFFTTERMMNALPSGHSESAFAVAVSLGVVLPRYRVPLIALAALVAVSRLITLEHFVGDIVLGSYVGIMAAVLARRWLPPTGVTPS